MFGEKVDYYLLRPFVHDRNKMTEEQLNEQSKNTTFNLQDAEYWLDRVTNFFFGGHLKVDPNLSYLDIGCGMGRLCIGLAHAGAKNVVGVDLVPRNIDEATTISRRWLGDNRPQFVCTNINDWQTDQKFDYLFAIGVMEHVDKPREFLARLPSLMKPGGQMLMSYEPFQSPLGDHMNHFFRVPIPWRGLIFNEKAILKLRHEYFRPTDPVERFQDIVGGLNKMRYGEWLGYLREAGLRIAYTNINPQLRKYWPLNIASDVVTSIPGLGRYFGHTVYVILKRIDDQ